MQELKNKIAKKCATVGIIGMGYVGLSLALDACGEGYNVVGIDIDSNKINAINSGVSHINYIDSSRVKTYVDSCKLRAMTDYSAIYECDIICICVPTPLDENSKPDISFIEKSAESIAKNLKKNTLVILESTTYPGTTEDVLLPILRGTEFAVGKNLFMAFSPERVDPGNTKFTSANTTKVVGGVTPACGELAADFYAIINKGGVHKVSSPKVAEMEKLLENTFRNVNIALANEMAQICHKMGVNVWEVVDAAATKPYGFMAFYPGPGLGGHCIPIDPYYLASKAKEYGANPQLIDLACEVNRTMPKFCTQRIVAILKDKNIDLKSANIFALGAAYKPNVDDVRESPALEITKNLAQMGAKISYNDPFVPKICELNLQSVEITKESLQNADLVLILTNHSEYKADFIAQNSKLIFDARNLLKDYDGENIIRL